MNPTERLDFLISCENQNEFQNYWNNCFGTNEKAEYMNKFAPVAPTFDAMNRFLSNKNSQIKIWYVKERLSGNLIGHILFGDFYPGTHPDSIGFAIGLDYKQKGYGFEALKELCDYCINTLGKTEIYGFTLSGNSGSIRLMEKCGFANLGPTGKKMKGFDEIKLRYSG
jgi:RimJ/RimL family protein N-acetyltransferase